MHQIKILARIIQQVNGYTKHCTYNNIHAWVNDAIDNLWEVIA